MNPLHKDNSYIEKDDAISTISELLEEIKQSQPQLQLNTKYNKRKNNSLLNIKKSKNFTIIIGLKNLYKNAAHNQMRIQDFVDSIINIHHEYKHLLQQIDMQNTPENCNRNTIPIAKHNIISKIIPEYYRKRYFLDPQEIDAETYAVEQTAEFFKINFPEIDIEKEITNCINQKEKWYARKPVHNIKEALDNLERARIVAPQLSTNLPGPDILKQPSKGLRQLWSNKDLFDKYKETSYEPRRVDILLEFIRREHPYDYTLYPCLYDEWPEFLKQTPTPKEEQRRLPKDIEDLERQLTESHDYTQYNEYQ